MNNSTIFVDSGLITMDEFSGSDYLDFFTANTSSWIDNFTTSTEIAPSVLSADRSERSRNLMNINYRVRTYLSEPTYIIALVLGIFSIAFNMLSVVALFQIRNRINTHYRLIISLAISDTLIGLSIVMYIINKVVHTSFYPGMGPWNERLKSRCLVVLIKALNTTAFNISLLNLMGMSIDHYTAITKPLKYHKLMGKNRAKLMILILWFIAIVCGFSDFFSAFADYSALGHIYNYCELVWKSKYQEEYLTLVIAFLCLFVMLFIYCRIYYKVRRHREPGQVGQMNLCRKREEKRNKKALITTLLVLGSFILCWLPTCLFQITLIVVVQLNLFQKMDPNLLRVLHSADKYLVDVLLLNCICDPIIYTVRCYEVRLGYKRLFGRFFCRQVPARRPSMYTSSRYNSFKTSCVTLTNIERPISAEWSKTLQRQTVVECNGIESKVSLLSNGDPPKE